MKEWQQKQVFLASLLYKRVNKEGEHLFDILLWGGHLFGGECLLRECAIMISIIGI